MRLLCSLCKREYAADTFAWRCDCGGVFELVEAAPFDVTALRRADRTLWRYRSMLPPVDEARVTSLGEGGTPLVDARLSGVGVLCKLEFLAPSGSFKDRGSAVLVSALRQMGITDVVEDSSGNAAASLAAYCARAGIHARIFAPAHTSQAKLKQISVYGAELVEVEGPRENAALAAQEAAAEGVYYASHNYNPLFLEGTKTYAYELWEQLGRAPDNLIIPVGSGGLLLGAYRGFRDLRQAGLIAELPRLYAVQARACAPLFEAFQLGLEDAPPVAPGVTAAEGIRIARPVRGRQVLRAIRETGGAVIAVEEQEIQEARDLLARQGLYVEPSSAAAAAALRHLASRIGLEDRTALALTGSGLKSG
jgi:threonine synthase